MVLSKLRTTCRRAALYFTRTTHTKPAIHWVLHTKSFPTWPSEDRHSSAVSHTQAHFPHFSSHFFTFFFSRTSYQQVLRRPGSCLSEQDPTMSQSWSPGGSWGDPAPISMDLTTPTLVPETKARAGSEEMGLPSAMLGAKSSGRTHSPRVAQGGGLTFPASQWESTDQATLTFSWGPTPWGQFCCLHETGENQTETEPNSP